MRRVARRSRTAALLLALLLSALAFPSPTPAAANERWCPPQAPDACAENAFLDFWRANGALEILGYPLDTARRAPDGLISQVYERAILEWHPELPPAYQVSLTRLGALLVEGSPSLAERAAQPPASCAGDCALYPETQHTLRGAFLKYWREKGGLAVFGYPLTEQYPERNAADGRTYLVQYFERNRFEWHPEVAGTPYEVQLGRLGAEYLAAAGATIRSWPPATVPNYSATPPTAGGDQSLVDTAHALIRAVPTYGYIVDTLAARNVRWQFAALPPGVSGSYTPTTNTITYAAAFRAMDPHDLAALTGHEGQHAYDYFAGAAPRTSAECYAFEYRGFLTEAALWRAWYGDRGKPDPVNDFERNENAILADILNNNGERLRAFIAQAYAEQCGARATFDGSGDAAIAPGGPLFTTAGLPALVTASFPTAADQLAALAGLPADSAVAAFAEPPPAWTVR